MANKQVKRCSTSLIREIQIKITMRYHLTLIRMAIIKKKKPINNKFWRGCEEKSTLLNYWCACKLLQPLWRTVYKFLNKLIKLSYDPAIPLAGIYPEKITIQKTHAPQCSLQHYLEGNLDIHQQMNG